MAKRGFILLKVIIVLVVAVFVVFAFRYIGQQFGSSEIYKKEVAAKEIALIIDAMYAYPYDSVVYYEKDLDGLVVEVLGSDVIIYNTGFSSSNLDPTYRKYEFIPTGNEKIKVRLESPKRIRLQKTAGSLVISKDG